MTIQKQLRLMTLITVLGLSAVIVLAATNLAELRRQFDSYQSKQAIEQNLIEIKATALTVARADPILAETGDALRQADARIQGLYKSIVSEPLTAPARKKISKKITGILAVWKEYYRGFLGAVKIAADSPQDALSIPDALYTMKLVPMVADLDRLVGAVKGREAASRRTISSSVRRILLVVLVPLILAGVLVAGFQMLFGRRLKRRIRAITGVVAHLRQGDLSRRLPAPNKDEISQMAIAINGFIGHFECILREVQDAAERTNRTAHRVSEMTGAVSVSADSQSEKVFQVSSAVEEMGCTIKEVARNVSNAAEAANETRGMVRTGNETGRNTISALNRIDETVQSSVQTIAELDGAIQMIGEVSKIIKDIAEQTNLLALNAAIEAARAGRQGLGFSVVADEVRQLSERTAESTTDIIKVVQKIQASTAQATQTMGSVREEVGQGVAYGDEMGKVLLEIDQSMHVVTEMMEQIASATEQQSAVGVEIAANMDAVAGISSSTAGDIDSTRDAMNDLARIADVLHETVAQFHLAEAAGREGG